MPAVYDTQLLPALSALETHVGDLESIRLFWSQHFGLMPANEDPLWYRIGDVTWRFFAGGKPCASKGPHGALPAFQIESFAEARGYLMAHGIRIVFEEMLPGLNLLIYLPAAGVPVALVQTTDPRTWQLAERRELRSKRRYDTAPSAPVTLQNFEELTIYTHDITASGRFYREGLGLPVGLSFFGHIHLVAENIPVVLRSSNWRCKTPEQRHGTEPVFVLPDLETSERQFRSAGLITSWPAPQRLDVVDPAGVCLHFEQG